jgi:hypothetical protein
MHLKLHQPNEKLDRAKMTDYAFEDDHNCQSGDNQGPEFRSRADKN